MSRHAKTTRLIETAAAILTEHHPMTVRQVYYQLVSRQVIENSRSAYQSVSKALVAARGAAFVAKHGDITVELDALTKDVLRGRILEEVERCMDLASSIATHDGSWSCRPRFCTGARRLGAEQSCGRGHERRNR